MKNFNLDVGTRFGNLVTLSETSKELNFPYHRRYVCKCDCGSIIITRRNALLTSNTKSCGCVRNIKIAALKYTHGLKHSPEYNIWTHMKQRCNNPNKPDYSYYGGRGIQVCDRWATSFEHFYTDMGPRPSTAHTIERLNNNGHYTPTNCVWETRYHQANNARTTIIIEFHNKKQSLSYWAKEVGIPKSVIYNRLHALHWSIEKTLTTPVKIRPI